MSEPPPRPAVPETLWALLAALACERAALALGPDPAALCAGAGVACALGALACAVARRTRARALVPLLAVLLASAACSSVSAALELGRQAALERGLGSSAVSEWSFELSGDMSAGATGWRGRARALHAGEGLGEVWLVSDERLEAGSTVTCVGRYEPNGDDDWGRSSRGQGLAGTVSVVRALSVSGPTWLPGAVLGLRSAVLESFDPLSSGPRALLAGAVCGSAAAASELGLDETFAACGVSHLVAVSGGHLVLVTALASSLLARGRLRPPARAVALLALSGLFVAFCGAPVSAVRSWAMSVVASASGLVGRRSHALSSASAVALAMALADPGVTGQLGFLLSVACVCGICALGGYARYAVGELAGRPRPPRRLPAPLRAALSRAADDAGEALALTLVSQVVTAPLVCSAFSQLSLVAPLANVLLGPLFSALLALGLVAACLVVAPPLQAVALAACDAVGGAFLAALDALAALPLASVPVSVGEGEALAALAAGLAALLVWWPRVRRGAALGCGCAAAACAAAWALRWGLAAPARVVVMDVGQGDAILLTDGAASALVDTGPGDAVVGALARNRVLSLDAVVLTHLHADHAGGLADVAASVPVGELVLPEGADARGLGWEGRVREVGHGDALRVGRFSLEVVSPLEPSSGEGNEGSLELLLSFDDGARSLTGLLCADAEREETGAVVARGEAGDVDFLKVGHHGSAASLTPELARALDPEVSVASAGAGNRYGHPDPSCVEALEAAGSTFLCTIEAGDVTVEPGERGPVVSRQRDGPVGVD